MVPGGTVINPGFRDRGPCRRSGHKGARRWTGGEPVGWVFRIVRADRCRPLAFTVAARDVLHK